MTFIKRWFKMNNYEYGVVKTDEFGNETQARRKGRKIQFILWKAGEHGHTEDYWHDMGAGWWDKFTAQPKETL